MAELVGPPIELVVIEFPGSQFNGEILPSIAQLIDDGIVTLLDALLVTKDDDGTVVSLEISDLTDDEQASFDQLDGEVGGLLSDSDVEAVGRIAQCRQLGTPARVGGHMGRPRHRRRRRVGRSTRRPRPSRRRDRTRGSGRSGRMITVMNRSNRGSRYHR